MSYFALLGRVILKRCPVGLKQWPRLLTPYHVEYASPNARSVTRSFTCNI